MALLDEIRAEVNEIASDLGLPDHRAFAYWYLEGFEDLSQEDAVQTIVDGPWDGGCDAVYEDDDASVLHLYQFKYSSNKEYVIAGLSDLQRATQLYSNKLKDFLQVRLTLVTTLSVDSEILIAQKRVQRAIRTWLTNSGIDCQAEVEIVDLKRFAQLLDKIFGVSVSLKFKGAPLEIGDALLGVVDARALAPFTETGELFAFNIRSFLGVRKKSVNFEIKETLENETERGNFWKMNNGIVCLCTSMSPEDHGSFAFKNLTIVNGAQTTSSIGRFVLANPVVQDPIWVVAKVVRVSESDVSTATLLTKTSNRQTPASSKDLRAVDTVHRILKDWFSERLGIAYVYRRGDRAPRASPYVTMKEMAQAYVAYWSELPNVAFARAGTIFTNDEFYESVFPEGEIQGLKSAGTLAGIDAFLIRRLIPYRVLRRTRLVINERVSAGEDKKWRSLAYHVVWVYRRIMEVESVPMTLHTLERIDGIVQQTGAAVFDSLADFYRNPQHFQVHKILKTGSARDALLQGDYLSNARIREARQAVRSAIL